MTTTIFCWKCLRHGCVCGFTLWASLSVGFASDDLELPPEHVPAAMFSAMGSSSSATVGSGSYLIHDAITGDEYSAMPLRATGPWVLKPEVHGKNDAANNGYAFDGAKARPQTAR